MAIIFKTEARRIIPRLRSLELAATTGELSLIGSKFPGLKFNPKFFLREQNEAWKKNKTIVHASDLLSSAFVLGLEKEYTNVAEFILKEASIFDSSILILAKKTLDIDLDEKLIVPIEDQQLKTRYEINSLKQVLSNEPKNPIAWMEIGRLYSLLGQIDKADKAIENALYLDKSNRFIIRSASRYYHHFSKEKDKALYVIRKSQQLSSDPWLISADIAYSTILGRYSKMAKIGENHIKNRTVDFYSITELASALGTLEYNNGKVKEARKYFNQSLIYPNDNSLAQAAWMSENIHGISIESSKYEMPLAFEANSLHYYSTGDFKSAFDEAMKWHLDEPYSTRPIKAASYIASVFLSDYKISIELTERGLTLAPDDIVLKNNLVYFLIQDNQLNKGEKIFSNSLYEIITNPDSFPENERVICTATAGLIAFRNNKPDLGNEYYQKAINIAKGVKNQYLVSLATINYVKEALKVVKEIEKTTELINILKEICKNNNQSDIKFMCENILTDYENSLSSPT
jgi:tetratricopeptide (TPR) repeat protein